MAIGSPVSPCVFVSCSISVPTLCPCTLSHLCLPVPCLCPCSDAFSQLCVPVTLPFPISLSLLPCPLSHLSSQALPNPHTASHLCPCLSLLFHLHVSVLCPHALSSVSLFPCPVWLFPHGPPMTCHAEPTRQDVP